MRARIVSYKGPIPLLFSFLLILLCLGGCAEDNSILNHGQIRQLEFSVKTCGWNNSNKSSAQKVPSRATPISGSTFDTSKSFNVIADVNKGGNWSTEVNNETASYSTASNIWQTSGTHYWPGSGSTVDFYAYYPTSISNNITHTIGSAPVLSYTVPDDAADQIDVLTSSKTRVAGNSYNQTPVDFKHIFAAIRFSVGSSGMINGTITKISLNGIQNTGSYSFTSGWTPQTSSTTTYAKNVSVASDAGTEIVSGNDPFLVMPQTLSNASFTVTYSGGATLTKNLSGTWEAGKVYEYNINSSFSATQDFSYTGDVQSYTVPFTGTYKLEVWGAQGYGWYTNGIGGLGGYSYGNIYLTQYKKIYICIGQCNQALDDANGVAAYNGGGCGSIAGGGATHISTTNRGVLSNYFTHQDEILIVAGGGGSGDTTYGGDGGGLVGGTGGDFRENASGYPGSMILATGGSQSSGGNYGQYNDGSQTKGQSGSFGQGGMGGPGGASNYGGGGGGGWYGGGGINLGGGGGGGSGHLGSTLISGTTGMQNGVRSGNGYAKITFISAN